MPGNPREIITMAAHRFPVRVRIAISPDGLGHAQITAWLDENCGSDGWTMTASGIRGVLNDAVSLYFADATLASAFVARRCVGSKVETAGGVFQVREDEPAPRVGAGVHRNAVRADEPKARLTTSRPSPRLSATNLIRFASPRKPRPAKASPFTPRLL